MIKQPSFHARFAILIAFCSISWALMRSVSAQDVPEYSRDILPILVAKCYECHGPDQANRQADLRLDIMEPLIEKSTKTTTINPGNTDLSELINRIESADPDYRMPPKESGAPLSRQEIQVIKNWIAKGAKTTKHWAFVKPTRPDLPNLEESGWSRNPIDLFVLERMKRQGLQPNPEADRFTLLRRLSLDLTGSNPDSSSVENLVKLADVDWRSIVEKLIHSPAFGEAQAIDWLDAARYADTMGHAADKPRSMWLYRDWVINAINDNMPFDQFAIEQLAGDMLPQPTTSQLVATGFHRNSIQALGNNPRKEEFRVKGIVDRLDTTGKAFLGLTVACAECHDHKYDPISQREYYELFAIFNNIPHDGEKFSVRGPQIQVHPLKTRIQIERLQRRIKEISERLKLSAKKNQVVENSIQRAILQLVQTPIPMRKLQNPLIGIHGGKKNVSVYGSAVGDELAFRPKRSEQLITTDAPSLFHSSIEFKGTVPIKLAAANQALIQGDFSLSLWIKTTQGVGDLVSRYDWKGKKRSFVFGIGSEGEPETKPGHLFLWVSEKNDPFDGMVAESSMPINDGQWHHVAVVFEAGKNIRLFVDSVEDKKLKLTGKIPKSIADSKLPLVVGGGYSAGNVANSFLFKGNIASLSLFDRAMSRVQLFAFTEAEKKLISVQALLPEEKRFGKFKNLTGELRKSLPNSSAEISVLQKQIARLEKATFTAQVMKELPEARETFVHIRGNFENRGERVRAAIPRLFFGANDVSKKRGLANRLDLAKQMVSRSNPLTARVAVNRIWQHHFGQGLVRTADDFGIRGTLPSHPKLLDWLAVEFMESGWDVKHIHRLIVDSATYRQTSHCSAENRIKDPSNQWLARGPRFRLKGEQIRDNALQAAGLLANTIGGPSVFPPQPDDVGQFRDETAGKWKNDRGHKRFKKSMYTFWQRMSPYPSLVLMNTPSRERCIVSRSTTNTPLQALVILNDPHFVEIARRFGDRILNSSSNNSERVKFGFVHMLSRLPTEKEQKLFEQYVGVETTNKEIWFQFAQVLFNLDEALTKE